MSLHYLVKLEKLIVHVPPLSCYRKKLQNLPHFNYVLQIRQIWIQLITASGKYYKRRCTKQASLIWSYQQHHWRMDAAVTTWPSLAQSILSCCFSSFRSLTHVLYIFSCNTPTHCNELDSNLANLRAIVEVGYSGVSSCNNPMVTCVWWVFQLSQGSVETLVRWRGKRLSLCSNFIQETACYCSILLESPKF